MKTTLQAIVLEARELFRDRGYDGMSMADLAARVGLKKASLYTRFPSKESLVGEVLTLTLDETFEGLAETDAARWRETYEQVIQRTASSLCDRKRCVGLHLAYGVSNDTPEARAAVRAYFAAFRDRLAAVLRPVMDEDAARDVAADAILRLEGATLWLSTMGDGRPMARVVDDLLAEAEELSRAAKAQTVKVSADG